MTRRSDPELRQVRHHAALDHGLAVEAIRASGPARTKVGFAENVGVALPIIDEPEHTCLGQLRRATSEQVPVDGYFLWSAQDNLEWVDGCGKRFGLAVV